MQDLGAASAEETAVSFLSTATGSCKRAVKKGAQRIDTQTKARAAHKIRVFVFRLWEDSRLGRGKSGTMQDCGVLH